MLSYFEIQSVKKHITFSSVYMSSIHEIGNFFPIVTKNGKFSITLITSILRIVLVTSNHMMYTQW